MITYVRGNLFESPAQVLVNTVNTVGVMGKGIALEFKRIYPEMFREYRQLCESGKFKIGSLYLYMTPHKWVLNFATKRHWRQPSRPEYIEAGLKTFVENYARWGIHSIAFPPLGCGNGELDFESQVQPIIKGFLEPLRIDVFIYPERPRLGPPEHKDVENIRAWLRSEPESLPFDEVWADLQGVLAGTRAFRTLKGGQFTAQVEQRAEGPPRLVIASSGKTYRIEWEELLEFWQQLRQHGFIYRRITSKQTPVSYLIPIFERLDYVQRVEVSETTGGLEHNAAVALQVKPPPRKGSPVGQLFEHRAG